MSLGGGRPVRPRTITPTTTGQALQGAANGYFSILGLQAAAGTVAQGQLVKAEQASQLLDLTTQSANATRTIDDQVIHQFANFRKNKIGNYGNSRRISRVGRLNALSSGSISVLVNAE